MSLAEGYQQIWFLNIHHQFNIAIKNPFIVDFPWFSFDIHVPPIEKLLFEGPIFGDASNSPDDSIPPKKISVDVFQTDPTC